MSTVAKKPSVSPVGRGTNSETGTSPPNPSHTRTNSVRSATPTGHSRTRSVRAAPVSARAAVARRDTAMSNVDSDARAAAAAALEDLQQRLEKEEKQSEQYRRQAEVLQSKLDDAVKESAKLEEKVHEHDELIETLRNEKREASRKIRETETIYEAERSAILKEKEEMANKEEEMQMVIARLKESLAQKMSIEDDPRPSRQSASASPSLDGSSFAPPSSLQRSDSRNSSKLILQKDKLIESLRLELAEAQIKLVESENQGGGRLHEVERLLMEARMSNARLMEDNESYQLLLQEKTLKGDFGQSDFSYMSPNVNHEALNALEGKAGGSSLADELSDATQSEGEYSVDHRRLESELKALKEKNKALTLYINKIIERLLQHQDFETILDQSADMKPPLPEKDKDLPPPPPVEKQPLPPPQFNGQPTLQRTRTAPIMVGRPRPRPFSVIQTSEGPGLYSPAPDTTDPEKAPSIPIGLGRANRRSRPASDQFPGAASLVSQMYRGPDGPASPPLVNSRHSHAFFPTAGVIGTPGRIPSGSQAPSSGNFPGTRGERSETSSLSGESGEISTPPSQSPPRSHSDKQTTFTGSKPRPLRLVQENPDAVKDNNTNKRASWISGWGWGGKKDDVNSPVSPAIPE
ncbi:m, serotype precursor [Trichoderma arundinaceum]|uniref:M, serotype n=1 Tax=Trichoderma arundinaceum TaxID=490622 RepID=A0A395NUU7_TRIAR|nr:m, serotype precursor [Trichoderma arundinaceum]